MKSEYPKPTAIDGLPPSVSQRELACHWKTSVRTLQRWRASGYGPPWLLIGTSIYYRIDDIRAFEDGQRHLGGRAL